MNIEIFNKNSVSNIDQQLLKKMIFIYNALEDGWKIKKKENMYIFSKNHENKKEIFLDSYLPTFIKENFDMSKIVIN